MICISAAYANQPGSRFDARYYTTQHLQFAEKLLRPHGLIALRLTIGVSDLAGAAPPFWALSELHFASREAFDLAMQRCGAELFADAANYTDVNPTLQISEIK